VLRRPDRAGAHVGVEVSATTLGRREHGDRRSGALRNLFNKLIGRLHHCPITGKQSELITNR